MLFCAFNFVLTILIIKIICVRKEKNIYLKNNLIFFSLKRKKYMNMKKYIYVNVYIIMSILTLLCSLNHFSNIF